MVHGKTHKVKSTGHYLKPTEVEKFPEDEVVVSWEKMSKSKYNGVDPEVNDVILAAYMCIYTCMY